MECIKSSSKTEVYSNKILLQKTEISNKQTKCTWQKLKREEQQEVCYKERN